MRPRVLSRRARPGDAPLIARVHVDRVYSWDVPSSRALEKNGFTLEGAPREAGGEAGVLHDEKIYARLARS